MKSKEEVLHSSCLLYFNVCSLKVACSPRLYILANIEDKILPGFYLVPFTITPFPSLTLSSSLQFFPDPPLPLPPHPGPCLILLKFANHGKKCAHSQSNSFEALKF